MKKVSIPRNQLSDWFDSFNQAAGCHKGDSDDAEQLKKFKYWCGRNCAVIKGVIEKAQKHINSIAPAPEYIEFAQARLAIAQKYAERDAQGKFIEVKGEDGRDTFSFTEEGRQQGDEALKALKKEYALAIANEEARAAAIKTYIDGAVEFELFTVPWHFAPERVSGSYRAIISAMFTDEPEPQS